MNEDLMDASAYPRFNRLWSRTAEAMGGFYHIPPYYGMTFTQDHAACLADARAGDKRAQKYIAEYARLRMLG